MSRTERQILFVVLAIGSFAATTKADMTMLIRGVDEGIKYELTGELDLTSVVASGSGRCGLNRIFVGSVNDDFHLTQFCSGGAEADVYTTDFSTIGSPIEFSTTLTADSLFYVGYNNFPDGDIDSLILPAGYESGTTVNLSHTDPNSELLSNPLLVNGAFWGVSFSDGNGGQQSLTFRIVPEPSSFVLLAAGVCFLGLARRR